MGREAWRSRKGAREGGGRRRVVVSGGRASRVFAARLLALDLGLEAVDLDEEAVDLELLLALEFLVEFAEAGCAEMLPVLSVGGVHGLRRGGEVRAAGSVAGAPGVGYHFAGAWDGGVGDLKVHLDLGSTTAYARAGGEAGKKRAPR